MDGENPDTRPPAIDNIINGLERYNPEAVLNLEYYLQKQCAEREVDCNANRTLLKLYQLNPDKIKEENITNILVLCLTQFPSPQFNLALHLVNPSSSASGELGEAISKLRELNNLLEGAEYARFWTAIDGDDLFADLVADIDGFEIIIRYRIALMVSHACREVSLSDLEQWLGLSNDAAAEAFAVQKCRWSIDDARKVAIIPKNADNEAKKNEIRENVSIDMFSRVIKRSWEETA